MYNYLIVGSGLYGAVMAQQLHAAGKKVLVIDKRPNIAGNVYTENVEGIHVIIPVRWNRLSGKLETGSPVLGNRYCINAAEPLSLKNYL